MMQTPELIIFDCDGVLVDSEVVFNEVLREDLALHGLELSLQETMAMFVGGSMETVLVRVESEGITLPADWIELIYDKVLTRLQAGVDVVAGIPELLLLLNEKAIPFCVASNGPVHKMHVTLGQNNLLPFFENAIFSGYDIKCWKPEPDLFLHAASQFSVSPQHCVVIEDSATGTLAAKNAQMPCLGYAPEGPDDTLIANGARCFSHMHDLPRLLGIEG